MPLIDTTTGTCCAETVNSAISLWTELEIVDDDDDLYTYQTMDTNSIHYNNKRSSSSSTAAYTAPPPGTTSCLKKPTILATPATVPDHPSLQWQEEAYWMSFRNAVQSFSDEQTKQKQKQQQSKTNVAQQPPSGGVPYPEGDHNHDIVDDIMLVEEMINLAEQQQQPLKHRDEDIDDDIDLLPVDDADFPPCLPRTVVTPTASVATSASGNAADKDCCGMSLNSAASASASASSIVGNRSRNSNNNNNNNGQQQQKQRSEESSSPKGTFAVIRKNLKQLEAEAAAAAALLLQKQQQQQQRRDVQSIVGPNSPGGRSAATFNSNASTGSSSRRVIPRGDFRISSSLAGPTAEELKGLRWRLKELADHAAAVVRGERGADQYVIGAYR